MTKIKTISFNKKRHYDYLVFIGRFQPFHLGHQIVIQTALERADKVLVFIGSSYQARTIRNPWNFEERDQFIKQSFSPEDAKRIITIPIPDLYNDKNWVNLVETIVAEKTQLHSPDIEAPSIGLIGHNKDMSSYYLSLFPQWNGVEVASFDHLSATPLREYYFSQSEVPKGLPEPVNQYLNENLHSEVYEYLKAENHHIREYKKSWASAPYPPVFVTVDAVVIQNNHVLLIERKNQPGKGLFALPGGFVDPHERLESAVIRELREETQINIPTPVLKESLSRTDIFDSPYRSTRGRCITHAYLFRLNAIGSLPVVIADDDAKQAFWLPLNAVNAEYIFEDHAHIIKTMTQTSSEELPPTTTDDPIRLDLDSDKIFGTLDKVG
ncbi:MAG: bifunctional nicotinamide-nucleotide adenylyltransferase/Nudix hydroxylase [Cocleimonas sp.]|nr:bifunctional nicotinamide-nucleotide adenylyltransferase/Nudix hydroxylase [Cocleimonas sp.]